MECHIPHKKIKLLKPSLKPGDKLVEERSFIDDRITCPLLSLGYDSRITMDENNLNASRKLPKFCIKRCETEPAPLFLPSSIKCGRGI